ncbi:ABC transporter permease [Nonomuraea sp. NPDC050202]|jgi:ABC-2 type transport system permease protein|uniref:ABC transporter permease n=1 Tax=Nonomuraea sp. NPDC050202 TaxID=3155035 RepID=UPI0033D639F8
MLKLALVETKLLTREPGALFSLLIPLFILVVFGSSIQPGDTVLLPMALAIAVGLVGLYLLPTTLATYRERGILRRLSITPVHPGSLLVVQLLLQLVLVVAACGLLMAVAGTVLGAHLPALVFSGVLAFLLGTASMFAIGSLVAALAPNGRAANGFGVLLYFPMAYLAGLMQPVDQMPDMVALVGTFTPLGAFVESLRDVWAGSAPSLVTLGVMAAYTLVISLAATKFFRWE